MIATPNPLHFYVIIGELCFEKFLHLHSALQRNLQLNRENAIASMQKLHPVFGNAIVCMQSLLRKCGEAIVCMQSLHLDWKVGLARSQRSPSASAITLERSSQMLTTHKPSLALTLSERASS